MQTYLSATRRFRISAFFSKFLVCDVAIRDADVSDSPSKPCSGLVVAGGAQRRSSIPRALPRSGLGSGAGER